MDKKRIGSFVYEDEISARLASDEHSKIEKIDKQIDYNNPKLVLSVYNKILESKSFKTPEGLLYLARLQDYLVNNLESDDEIKVIPVADFFISSSEKETKLSGIELREIKDKALLEARKEVQLAKFKKKDDVLVYRIVIAFLIVLVMGMFVITAFGKGPTILNYREKIQNEYSEWEKTLEEKEAELEEREARLGGL